MNALSVHVVAVAGDGEAVTEQLAAAGHTVSGPEQRDPDALADAIRNAPGADVVVIVGGAGARGPVPEVLAELSGRALPGYGERVRREGEAVLGIGAIGLRAEAAMVGEVLVAGVPAHPELGREVVRSVLLPFLGVLDAEAPHAGPAADPPTPEAPAPPVKAAATPTRGLSLGLSQPAVADAPADDEETAAPTRGWLAAVQALEGEVHIGRREELPEPIEKLAPVVNVLHTAGEVGTLRLPSGRRYGLYGWPDLRRPGAKVIAVSWGDPLAEIVVLHRHPHPVGTTIEGDLGLLPSATSGVADAAERATGRAPDDLSGTLFALESDTVWILRGRRVFKWDGRRERDDGNPKQALASLTLRWSNH
jgi:molybdopterin biosynthesis enzyme MoaB